VHDLKEDSRRSHRNGERAASQIQKLSAQVQVSKPGLQKVVDNQ